ncbi:MAG: ribonuclease P protein component [Rickettsiales bacterium]|jgi:ribonuclease P protein component|nr:ribonuclease P protein component [Rickettsiales bacterium]
MRNTLKKHWEFAISETEPAVATHFFIARTRPTIFPGDARYGLIATKKTFRAAVDRNRAKRLLRVWMRKNETLLDPDLDYVFIARRAILDATLTEGAAMMKRALKKTKATAVVPARDIKGEKNTDS